MAREHRARRWTNVRVFADPEGSGAYACRVKEESPDVFAAKRHRRHIVVGALVGAVALVPAQAASASSLSPQAKKAVRAELRKTVKRNPGVIRQRSFLRKAALVNFKLPSSIALRADCRASCTSFKLMSMARA